MAVHFTGPVLFTGKNSPGPWWTNQPVSNNVDYVTVMDDFTGIAIDATNDWDTSVKDAGASVAIVADDLNGAVAITSTATTDDDGGSIQGNEVFAVQTDKNIWFETRVKCNDADQTDLCFGLTVNFATNPEAMLTAADRIVFQVNDGNASILCKTEKNGTETSTDSGIDLADSTYVVLGFLVNSTGYVQFFINRQLVATHTTNIPDDENLAIGAMSVSGSATGTRVTTIDYLFCAADR
jgi:hypothetical protein